MAVDQNISSQVPIPCRICGSVKFKPRFTKNGFKIEKCLLCGLTQVTNPPNSEEVSSCYGEEFFDAHYEPLQNNGSRQDYEYRKFDSRLVDIERWALQKGKILDVGCSFGFFLEAARRRGWEVYGLEISEFAANYARTQFEIPVVTTPLGDSVFQPDLFDVVTMWNVIEHLEDPLSTLQQVCRILKPHGTLVLTTGNIESTAARVQGTRWRMLIPPIHLMHFSPPTIGRVLAACGFQLVEQTCALPYEFMLRKMGLLEFVRKMNISDKMLVYARKMPRQGNGLKLPLS